MSIKSFYAHKLAGIAAECEWDYKGDMLEFLDTKLHYNDAIDHSMHSGSSDVLLWGDIKQFMKSPMLPATDHRIFSNDDGTPTVQLGCGNILMVPAVALDGSFAGVGFSLMEGDNEIGKLYPEAVGKNTGELNCFLNIIATDPRSIDGLIAVLQDAKADWEKADEKG